MTKQEIIDLMQSDMQLWDTATTGGNGTNITKTLDLPFGIGPYTVNFEGVTYAQKRRAAVTGYGEHIRDLIREHIDDDIITAKAKQQAARVSEDAGPSVSPDGLTSEGAAPVVDRQTTPALAQPATFAANIPDRVDELRDYIERAETELRGLRKELKALEAALEVMNAPEDSGENEEGS